MICNENISVHTMGVCVWGAQLTFWWHKRGWAGGRREHSGGVQPLITEAEAVSVEWLCTCWNEQGDRSADKWDGDGFYFSVYYTPPAAIWSVSGEHLQRVILWHKRTSLWCKPTSGPLRDAGMIPAMASFQHYQQPTSLRCHAGQLHEVKRAEPVWHESGARSCSVALCAPCTTQTPKGWLNK